MDIFSSKFMTAASTSGVYVGPRQVLSLLTDRPLQLFRFDLSNDEPRWEIVDPREVDVDFTRLRKLAIDLRRRLRTQLPGLRDPLAEPWSLNSEQQIWAKNVRDLRRLRQNLGTKRFRIARQIPKDSKPFLLLWLAQRIPEFGQLLEAAPFMAVMISLDHAEGVRLDLDDLVIAVREEVRMRRAEVLESHGFPGEAVAGMRKVTLRACNAALLPGLRRALQEPEILSSFVHAKTIGPDLLAIHAEPALFHRTDGRCRRLLAEREEMRLQKHIAPMLEAHARLSELAGETLRPSFFSSPHAVVEWYNLTCKQIKADDLGSVLSLRCPDGPFLDEPEGMIRQIRNGRQALKTAVAFENCVCSPEYVERMEAGECFLYVTRQAFGMQACVFEVVALREDADGRRTYGVVRMEAQHGQAVRPATRSAIAIWVQGQGGLMCDKGEHQTRPDQMCLFERAGICQKGVPF